MLIRLISPKPEHLYGPPLPIFTIIYLAALTPSAFDVEIIDERIAEIPYDKKADLVGITVMSGSDVHAYEITENYKNLRVPVILGGFHTSLFHEEASGHVDAIWERQKMYGKCYYPILKKEIQNPLTKTYT